MPWHNKIIWSEGLFLRPHHFQQHDRYVENLISTNTQSTQVFAWGFTQLNINRDLLKLGKFAIAACEGIMPDGTPFNAPEECDAPPPMSLPDDARNEIIYLALPFKRLGSIESENDLHPDILARYSPRDNDVRDSNAGYNSSAELQVGQLRLRLMLGSEDRSCYACIPIAKIIETRPDEGVVLDENFLPTCLNCHASSKLLGFIKEFQGLLQHRGVALANRVTSSGTSGVSEIADFMLLQVVNRLEPFITHLSKLPVLHPEDFYQVGIQAEGELATFTRREKRPSTLPGYQHEDLQATFGPLMTALRQSLTMVLEQNATPIVWEERNFGIRIATVADVNLIHNGIFILAVKANMSPEKLVASFTAQAKIGPQEHIRQMVNSGLPGIGIQALPVAPRQLPFHAGFTYFQLDKSNRYWSALEQSKTFALHIAGEFPGLELEFWAIKG